MPETAKQICLVAAMGRNRAIGLNGKMPWHLPGELQHFKATTMGKPIVMGRKTWESIGRPLSGRQNIVISRNSDYPQDGFDLCASLQQAVETANGTEIMVIGGGELYKQALPLAQRMVLSLVDCAPAADTFFPAWDAAQWQELSRVHKAADEQNPYACEIVQLQRIAVP
ncbi:MAG: dihydrofolate reductase [Xanthomonadales bacterium]|nr:dihydrofolate reductase [Xanthomonadales bacterium]